MNVTAVSSISRVAASPPARSPLLDDNRALGSVEWSVRNAAASEVARGARAQAAWQSQRVARMAVPERGDIDGDAVTRGRQSLSAEAVAPAAVDVDRLRDLCADARLRRAADEFSARFDPVALRADSANDLGAIDGLTPLQPYRVAMASPQAQALQTAAVMKAAGLGIPKVKNIGATENATDNARYRPGYRT